MKNITSLILLFVGVIMLIVFIGIRITANINFDRECGSFLVRAAQANTVPLAADNLKIATNYLERHEMTSGYTSVAYNTPDEDVGYWYSNLTAAQSELASLSPNATAMERTNVLMKMRESLIGHTSDGEQLVCPTGISIFPNNSAMAMLGWLSITIIIASIVGAFITD